MQALNRLPGPKFGKAHCSIWVWLVLMITKNLQVGGIIGTVALILNIVFPTTPIWVFLIGLSICVSALVSLGYYQLIEKSSIVMIGIVHPVNSGISVHAAIHRKRLFLE